MLSAFEIKMPMIARRRAEVKGVTLHEGRNVASAAFFPNPKGRWLSGRSAASGLLARVNRHCFVALPCISFRKDRVAVNSDSISGSLTVFGSSSRHKRSGNGIGNHNNYLQLEKQCKIALVLQNI
jgi:hypothetical protein